jgi:hypothetical protein
MNVVWGAGGLAGSLAAARVVTRDSEPAAAVLGCLLFGAFVAAVGLSPWFALIVILNLLLAASDSFAFVVSTGSISAGPRTRSAGGYSPPLAPS